jgi:YidC/Oxa1 family membrane protein insertase
LAAALVLLLPASVFAIPSPDVVIGVFASAAQLLGLLTVMLGGAVFAGTGQGVKVGGRKNHGPAPALRWGFRITAVLLLVSVGANLLQYANSSDCRTERLRKNLVRASMENGVSVGDVSLKTMSFSDQKTHRLGLTTDQLAQLIEEGNANIIDVREPEEFEMGWLEGAQHVRYPDLKLEPSRLNDTARTNIILCFSGNRSSELCEEFENRDKPIPCHFIVGGYEKWIAEGRELVGVPGGGRDSLRSLPAHTNEDVLLDTPDAEALVADRDAVFVDVRYEEDFRAFHIPGAINLPLRKLPSDEMAVLLREKIPQGRPVIVPCYDKRSSFYGSILAVRLERMGIEFAGRYTVPHEYTVAKADREHVAAWKEANNVGLIGVCSKPLAVLVRWLDGTLGHLALALVAAVLFLRCLLLPLTLKNERDQILQRRLAPQIAQIKIDTAGDPARQSRATIALFRKYRLTPARNLLGSMAQIFLFILFFAAVHGVAATTTDGFLWINSLSEIDPFFVLPSLLGVMVFTHLTINGKKHGWKQHVARLASAGLLMGITLQLPSALNVYLVLNVALMMLQNRLVARWLDHRERATKRILDPEELPEQHIIPLGLAHRVPGCGGKAIRLAQMKAAGLPVPDGFVATASLLSGESDTLKLSKENRRVIDREWRRLGAERVAVRSSGLNEDGESQSYAGMFESILNVSRDGFESALNDVHQSFQLIRASSYSGGVSEVGGVVVQSMVDAEYSGVLFTEHPNESGSLFVEMVAGLGAALVSGTATPEGFRFGRFSGELLDEAAAPIDLTELIALARQVEKLFGKPQDIEWAYRDGHFQLLQARDITASSAAGANASLFEKERRRLLEIAKRSPGFADEDTIDSETVLFGQNELSELLPRPTALSLSFMQSLWSTGGSTDIACRALGIPYRIDDDSIPMVESVFGGLYINRPEEGNRLSKGAGAVSSFRLSLIGEELERSFRDEFTPSLERDVRRRETMDLGQLSVEDLVSLLRDWSDQFVTETYVQAEFVNIAADFYLKNAERELEKRGLAPATYLAQMPETVVHRAMSMLPGIKDGDRPLSDFVALFGHRAPLDYELAMPRYREDQTLITDLLTRTRSAKDSNGSLGDETAEIPELPEGRRVLRMAVDRATRFQALKEESKHQCLRELALLRGVLLALDREFASPGDIFYLRMEEVGAMVDGDRRPELLGLIDERKKQETAFLAIDLPVNVRVSDLEALGPDGQRPKSRRKSDGELAGILVAGNIQAFGPARVVKSEEELESFRDGEILVARFTEPTWTPLFPRASGVITEVGGRLSHAAIVAREFNVPVIVGVEGAMDRIRTGDMICLHLDGRITSEDDRRREQRHDVRLRVALRQQDAKLQALLVNISVNGALVNSDEELTMGQDVTIQIGDEEESRAQIVRRDAEGRYALRFEQPIAISSLVGTSA